jgi:branched-chain amino acid transport system ATP-binding protein
MLDGDWSSDVCSSDLGYREVRVLHGLSLHVPEGALVGLIGSNGAGKTTILRVLTGLLPAQSGSASFGGEELLHREAHRIPLLGLVQVPEGGRVFPYLTVLDNLLLGSSNRRAKPRRAQRLAEVYDLFPRLKERAGQLGGTLSGGERQMLALGQALMAEPRCLLLDEPSLGLAPKVISEIFARLELIRARGITILLVEQNVRLCLRLADYAYVLENGRIVLEGSGRELLGQERIKKAYLGLG